MARFVVWTKGQAVSVLLGAAMLLVQTAVMATLLLLLGQAPIEEPAVAAFAGVEVTVETPAPVFRVEVIRETKQPALLGKRVLIYHTHTWEAFEQVEGNRYQETEKWRTKDNNANMVAVGDALTAALGALGCEVVHDDTAFEPPDLSTAYQRSLTMLEQRLAQGESYDLYIDLHRDAVGSASTLKRTVSAGGEEIARFMVLVGKGQSYAEKPDWQANYALAEGITQSLNRQVEGLCRAVKVKTGRFNQHIAPCCVLIECGLNYNTLEQVLRGVPYLAQAIVEVLAP